jgi:DNA-binding NarL/FixJ family response regulator
VAQARRFLPHVALLDDNLPDMNGVQLAEKLGASFPKMANLIASGRAAGRATSRLSRPTTGALPGARLR